MQGEYKQLQSFLNVILLQALIPALCMNVYIVGLNQIHDIEIDKVILMIGASKEVTAWDLVGLAVWCHGLFLWCKMWLGSDSDM